MKITSEDKRFPLLQQLIQYQPVDSDDAERCAQIQSFVEDNTFCFERSNLAGHITGSAWIVDKTGDKVLLTHHKKLGKWLQLGGHADGNPNTLATALREAQEESGLPGLYPLFPEIFDLDVHPIPERPGEPEHLHYDIRFLIQAGESEAFTVSPESTELAWVELDHVKVLSKEESMLRMVRKWKVFRSAG